MFVFKQCLRFFSDLTSSSLSLILLSLDVIWCHLKSARHLSKSKIQCLPWLRQVLSRIIGQRWFEFSPKFPCASEIVRWPSNILFANHFGIIFFMKADGFLKRENICIQGLCWIRRSYTADSTACVETKRIPWKHMSSEKNRLKNCFFKLSPPSFPVRYLFQTKWVFSGSSKLDYSSYLYAHRTYLLRNDFRIELPSAFWFQWNRFIAKQILLAVRRASKSLCARLRTKKKSGTFKHIHTHTSFEPNISNGQWPVWPPFFFWNTPHTHTDRDPKYATRWPFAWLLRLSTKNASDVRIRTPNLAAN